MKIINEFGWVYYIGDYRGLSCKKVGKWMYFFNDRKFVERICIDVVQQEIVAESKHSDKDEGVACFYLNCDDFEGHRKIITYFLENSLIRKTSEGRLYNISFKRDKQTELGEYGSNFKSEIKIEKFIDLTTGKWKITEDEFELLMPPDIQSEMRSLKAFIKAKEIETTPIEEITYEQSQQAVQEWSLALKFVPEQYRSEEICRSAMQHQKASVDVVEYIPSRILTPEFVDDVIKNNTYLIGSFPSVLLKKETVIKLAAGDLSLLKEIPAEIKNLSFYEMLVRENGMALKCMPRDLITEKICEIALKSKPVAIKYVPKEIITQDYCKLAVANDWKAIRSIPQCYLTNELFEFAIDLYPKYQNKILKEKNRI